MTKTSSAATIAPAKISRDVPSSFIIDVREGILDHFKRCRVRLLVAYLRRVEDPDKVRSQAHCLDQFGQFRHMVRQDYVRPSALNQRLECRQHIIEPSPAQGIQIS